MERKKNLDARREKERGGGVRSSGKGGIPVDPEARESRAEVERGKPSVTLEAGVCPDKGAIARRYWQIEERNAVAKGGKAAHTTARRSKRKKNLASFFREERGGLREKKKM